MGNFTGIRSFCEVAWYLCRQRSTGKSEVNRPQEVTDEGSLNQLVCGRLPEVLSKLNVIERFNQKT